MTGLLARAAHSTLQAVCGHLAPYSAQQPAEGEHMESVGTNHSIQWWQDLRQTLLHRWCTACHQSSKPVT